MNTHSRAKMTPSGGELLVKRVKDGLGGVFSAIRRAREFHFSQEAAAGLRRLAVLTGRAPAAGVVPGT